MVRNVVDAVEPPRKTKYEALILDREEVLTFLDQITDPLHQTLALLATQTGLRRSEMLGLHWRDIDLSAGTLSVRRALIKLASGATELKVPKNDHGRVVDLPPRVRGGFENSPRAKSRDVREWQFRFLPFRRVRVGP